MFDSLFPRGAAHYLGGGLLIGGAVALLFVLLGRVGGMSSFFSAIWTFVAKGPGFAKPALVASRGWRIAYAIGVAGGAALFVALGGEAPQTTLQWGRLLLGGVLVGFGARLGGGCTSGHGICGLASLQKPSLLAVLTFLATAMVTARVVQWLAVAATTSAPAIGSGS